jgi:hypothetical protein
MKRILIATIVMGLTATLHADSYSVFRVCQDQHVIHTSDGAEAGRVEYIVVDPAQQRIVSTVITGGVIGERHIAVPYSDIEINGEHDIVLTNIDRERIVAAPEIEVSRFASSSVVEPAIVDRSVTYFGGNSTEINRSTSSVNSSSSTTAPENGQSANEQKADANSHYSVAEPSRDNARPMGQAGQHPTGNRASERTRNTTRAHSDRNQSERDSSNIHHHRSSAESSSASTPSAADMPGNARSSDTNPSEMKSSRHQNAEDRSSHSSSDNSLHNAPAAGQSEVPRSERSTEKSERSSSMQEHEANASSRSGNNSSKASQRTQTDRSSSAEDTQPPKANAAE